MNYKKYEVFNESEYKKLLKEKSFLEKETQFTEYTFFDLDGKVSDRKTLSLNEYNKLPEGEKQKLRRYKSSRAFNKKSKDLLDLKTKEANDFYIDFRKNVKSRFISDFSKKYDISEEKTVGILKYSLSQFSFFNESLSISISEEDIDRNELAITYDKFIDENNVFYSRSFENLAKSMINTLELFKVMAGN